MAQEKDEEMRNLMDTWKFETLLTKRGKKAHECNINTKIKEILQQILRIEGEWNAEGGCDN